MQNLSFPKLCLWGCRAALVCLILLCAQASEAQQPEVSVIDSLRVPTSPAFKIVGTEPTAVERPTDLKALAIDLSTIGVTSGTVPAQFALEFGISKLFSHGKKGLYDYYYPSLGSAIVDNLSISLATAEIPADMFVDTSYHSSAAWSFGFRTHLLSGGYAMDKSAFQQFVKDSISLKDNVDRVLKYVLLTIIGDSASLSQLQSAIASGSFAGGTVSASNTVLFDNAFGKVLYSIPGLAAQLDMDDLEPLKGAVLQYFGKFVHDNSQSIATITPSGIPSFLLTYNDWSTTNILNSPAAVYSAKKLASILTMKSGHYLEIAFAGAGVGRNDRVDEFSLKRFGAWLSYSYRPPSPTDWEAAASLRLISNEVDSAQKAVTYDLGCRASSPRIWAAALSLEAIVRFSPEYKPDFRIAVIGEYPLTQNFYLTATFGRGFDLQSLNAGNLLSVLGIKFALGSDKLVLPGSDLQ